MSYAAWWFGVSLGWIAGMGTAVLILRAAWKRDRDKIIRSFDDATRRDA